MNNDRIKKFDEAMGFYSVTGDFREWLISQGFFVKPAAISHHGNYTGGLFDHSLEVMGCLVEMTKKFDIKWQDERSPYLVGMFHDLCKLDDYIDENASDVVVMGTGSPVSNDPQWVKNPSCILSGHGDKSVIMLSQFLTLTEEEIFCISFHMGAYETSRWNQFDAAIRKYETVLWTHTADMYASKVIGK
jgi:hypothetical protein